MKLAGLIFAAAATTALAMPAPAPFPAPMTPPAPQPWHTAPTPDDYTISTVTAPMDTTTSAAAPPEPKPTIHTTTSAAPKISADCLAAFEADCGGKYGKKCTNCVISDGSLNYKLSMWCPKQLLYVALSLLAVATFRSFEKA